MRESFEGDIMMNDIWDGLIDMFSATKMDLPIICGLGYNNSGTDNPGMLTVDGQTGGLSII